MRKICTIYGRPPINSSDGTNNNSYPLPEERAPLKVPKLSDRAKALIRQSLEARVKPIPPQGGMVGAYSGRSCYTSP